MQTPVLDWKIAIAKLSDTSSVTYEADAADCARLAQLFDVSQVRSFTFAGKVRALRRERFHVEGVVTADITQACIVTLEPIETTVTEDVSQAFWPEDAVPEPLAEEEVDPFEQPPEPIRSGHLELGQLAYELISAQIDPYPRKDGEELGEVSAGTVDDDVVENPFAVLKDLPKG